ncbi:microfibril-associated glycoprotein 4-like [Drosophila tropicalis]|uniref:microfibril-associated glycoprotein 4-like n=1 Tax=Drosophila tropicalis TaxID=46794 RepID=UPI0035ABD9C7
MVMLRTILKLFLIHFLCQFGKCREYDEELSYNNVTINQENGLNHPIGNETYYKPNYNTKYHRKSQAATQLDNLKGFTKDVIQKLEVQLVELDNLKTMLNSLPGGLNQNAERSFATSCLDANVNNDGVHKIQVPGLDPFMASCNTNVAGAGWLVIQRRIDGGVNFFRSWSEYRDGFGDLMGNFFIGLEKLRAITAAQPNELYIHLEDFDGETRFAKYEEFAISNEAQAYALNTLGKYSGTAGDSLRMHEKMKFTTYDRDNDKDKIKNCAVALTGGWWYENCIDSNLNGVYLAGSYDETLSGRGICWEAWRGFEYSYKNVIMMIRPRLPIQS